MGRTREGLEQHHMLHPHERSKQTPSPPAHSHTPRSTHHRTDRRTVSWLPACTAAWLGSRCLWLVQSCWPALVGWRLLCVNAFGGFLLWFRIAFASPSLYSVFRPGQASRASASVSRRVFGRRGIAPAPRLQLCVRWDGICCARGGCRAGLHLLLSLIHISEPTRPY